MLQLMIDATGEEKKTAGDGESEAGKSGCPFHKTTGKMTSEEVVGHARVVLLAGYETTANTLAYTSYLLALNPDIQEKLQSEIDSYFDENPVSLLDNVSVMMTDDIFHLYIGCFSLWSQPRDHLLR